MLAKAFALTLKTAVQELQTLTRVTFFVTTVWLISQKIHKSQAKSVECIGDHSYRFTFPNAPSWNRRRIYPVKPYRVIVGRSLQLLSQSHPTTYTATLALLKKWSKWSRDAERGKLSTDSTPAPGNQTGSGPASASAPAQSKISRRLQWFRLKAFAFGEILHVSSDDNGHEKVSRTRLRVKHSCGSGCSRFPVYSQP